MAIKILRLSGKCLQRLSKIEAVEFYPFFVISSVKKRTATSSVKKTNGVNDMGLQFYDANNTTQHDKRFSLNISWVKVIFFVWNCQIIRCFFCLIIHYCVCPLKLWKVRREVFRSFTSCRQPRLEFVNLTIPQTGNNVVNIDLEFIPLTLSKRDLL